VIEIAFLGSGSSGNCAVVRVGRTMILLDAGLSPRQIGARLGKLGMTLDDVSALLLTHEHSDHVASAAALATKRGLPVYGTRGTLGKAGLPGPLFADLRTVTDGDEIVFGGGDLTVRVTETPHDGVEPVCYVFADGEGRRVGVATDLGHLSRKVLAALEGCDVLGLEANHDVDVLREGAYPAFLKKRILSDVGHLSNDAAAAGLERLLGERTRILVGLHLSKNNNTPALAERALRRGVERLGAKVVLEMAGPDAPTGWLRARPAGGNG
jgi:phosphoribosyl 1,2-cyclic phosphodiesterase